MGDLDLLKVTQGEGVPPHVGPSEELQGRRVGQRALQFSESRGVGPCALRQGHRVSEGRAVGHHAACLGLVLQSH